MLGRVDQTDMLPGKILGQPLEVHVQRGGHPQPAVGDHFRAVKRFQLLPDVDGKVRRIQADFLRGEIQGFQIGRLGRRLIDQPVADHVVEHKPLAVFRSLQIRERVQIHRTLRQAGQ